MTALDDWIDDEARFAASAMLRAVSATNLVKERPGFGQRVVPRRGSVLASPVPAAYDPDPDYFFHWFRDSAIIIDALRVAEAEGSRRKLLSSACASLSNFSWRSASWTDASLFVGNVFREKIQPSFLQYVRPDDEIAAVFGEAVLAEARVNPDGTLDFTRWARPQNDGPALASPCAHALATRSPHLDDALQAAMRELVDRRSRLHPCARAERSFDIWEEEIGYHYYTRLVQAEALLAAPNGSRKSASKHVRATAVPSADELALESRRLLERGCWLLPLKDRRRRRRSGKGSRHCRDSRRASRWAHEGSPQRARPEERKPP